jgi:UV DNA damage endonuclease
MKTLSYNAENGMLFFRITSDLIPFASHPVCKFPWQKHFSDEFLAVGEYIQKSGFRISMHPDQFVLLNTPDRGILERSIADLTCQAAILDLMELDTTAKLQIHTGGVYGDKTASLERFVSNYQGLDDAVKKRLVVENDERLYTISECMTVHERTGIPVLFDVFHHSLHNNGEKTGDLFAPLGATWKKHDGIPMVDYSSQQPKKRAGAHADSIDQEDFVAFLKSTIPFDMDIMLEIKDKEKSALPALGLAHDDTRLVIGPGKA